MANLDRIMERALGITGAFATAISDYDSGMSLGSITHRQSFDPELAGALNGEVVKAKLAAAKTLKISTRIEDILITLEDQYHLIRLVPDTSLFIYLALDRDKANLAMARHELRTLEGNLVTEMVGA